MSISKIRIRGQSFTPTSETLLRQSRNQCVAIFLFGARELIPQDIPASVEADALTSYKRLFALLPGDGRLAKLVVYIDEAQTLLSLGGITNATTMYDVVHEAVSAFNGFFFLFVSTDSRIQGLAPKAGLSCSSRIVKAANYLVAPLTEMPFDCHPSLPIRSGLKLEEVQTFSFAVRFGRPL